MAVKSPMVVGSSPVWSSVAFLEAEVTCCWFLKCLHPKMQCSLRGSNVVRDSIAAGVACSGTGGSKVGFACMAESNLGESVIVVEARSSLSVIWEESVGTVMGSFDSGALWMMGMGSEGGAATRTLFGVGMEYMMLRCWEGCASGGE